MMTRPSSSQATERGGRGRLVFLTWAGLYPLLTLIALALEPYLSPQPIALQTLIMSAIMVPVMVLVVMPAMRRWL